VPEGHRTPGRGLRGHVAQAHAGTRWVHPGHSPVQRYRRRMAAREAGPPRQAGSLSSAKRLKPAPASPLVLSRIISGECQACLGRQARPARLRQHPKTRTFMGQLKHRIGTALCLLLLSAPARTWGVEALPDGETPYRRALRSTAWVRVGQDQKLARMGTGFLVDRSRKLLVTNQHVVENQETVEVVFPLYQGGGVVADKKNYIRYDRPIRGWVVAMDPKRDLAVIELEIVPH